MARSWRLMKSNKILIFAFLFIFAIAQVSAVDYFSYNYRLPTDNVTTRLFSSIYYTTYEQPTTGSYQFSPNWLIFINPILFQPFSIGGLTSDLFQENIDDGKPLEFYILYSSFVDEWNAKNPSNQVNYCNLTVTYNPAGTQQETPIFTDILTATTYNAKYFIRINKGDTAKTYLDCLFAGNRSLIMPAHYTIVFPTWECKACQYYEWNKDFIKLEKAKNLNTYYVEVWKYIKSFIQINYSFLVTFFWIFLIALLFVAISLIFTGIYVLYMYLAKKTR